MTIRKKPPNAGKGRVKGVPNRTPAALREAVTQLVENNLPGAQALYDRVAAKNPAKALELLAKFAEFVLPKQREISGSLTTFAFNADTPITSADEAARIYQALMGDPSIDITGITFASPAALPAPQEAAVAAISVEPSRAIESAVIASHVEAAEPFAQLRDIGDDTTTKWSGSANDLTE